MKTNKIIFDASALLILINKEQGHTVVEKYLDDAIMSCVNYCEVISVLCDFSIPLKEARELSRSLLTEVIAFDEPSAMIAADLRKSTKKHGLSFGDRACLALAKKLDLPVLTADKIWKKLDIGIEILLAR